MVSALSDAAQSYAVRGWSVLPLHAFTEGCCTCGRPDCGSPGKHPRTAHGLKDATSDQATIADWWQKWPNANIGLLTGEAFDVLDVDGEEGRASITGAVHEQGHKLPTGPRTITGGGGAHVLFSPTGSGNRAGVLPKVDWRGQGGYIVAPPSLHASGQHYEWSADATLDLPEAPDWLRNIVAPPFVASAVGTWKELPTTSGDGTPYGLQALEAELAELRRSAPGTRNHTLNACTFSLYQLVGGGELKDGAVEQQLRMTAAAIGLSDHEITQTIVSASGAGLDRPRNAPLRASYTQPINVRVVASELGEEAAPTTWLTPIIWTDFWANDEVLEDWLLEPLIPAGRQVAIYSTAKAGKSLLSVEIAAALATGRPCLGQPARPPMHVIYIDQEMTQADLRERLEDLGYGPEANLDHLHYYQLQDLTPLDTDPGGIALMAIVKEHGAVLVILDTMARVVQGEENNADTYRDFYRCTGRRLKAAAVALLRLDHAGKEPERGQRGSSSKDDDLDVVFRLTLVDDEYVNLKRTRTRVPWVKAEISFRRETEPLRHTMLGGDVYPAGTAEAAALLDQCDVALDASVSIAVTAMHRAGVKGKRRSIIAAALKWRRQA